MKNLCNFGLIGQHDPLARLPSRTSEWIWATRNSYIARMGLRASTAPPLARQDWRNGQNLAMPDFEFDRSLLRSFLVPARRASFPKKMRAKFPLVRFPRTGLPMARRKFPGVNLSRGQANGYTRTSQEHALFPEDTSHEPLAAGHAHSNANPPMGQLHEDPGTAEPEVADTGELPELRDA